MKKIRIIILTVSLLPTLASAEVIDAFAVKLDKFMTAQDLKAEDLNAVAALPTPNQSAWTRGFIGPVKQGAISLQATLSGDRPISRSLMVRYIGVAVNPYEFYSCSPRGDCSRLTATVAGHRTIGFTHEGTQWEMSNSVAPCIGHLSCEFRIPSWALEKRRQLSLGAMEDFPAVAAIVDHSQGVTILDASRGSIWLNVAGKLTGSVGDRLGQLKGAMFVGDGLLSLRYSNGLLVFDFISDRLFAIDKSGVRQSEDGLGQTEAVGWYKLKFPAGTIVGTPLAANVKTIVWSDSIGSWSPRSRFSSKILGTLIDAPAQIHDAGVSLDERGDPNGMDTLSFINNEAQHARVEPLTLRLDPVGSKIVTAEQIEVYALNGGSPMLLEQKPGKPSILPYGLGLISAIDGQCSSATKVSKSFSTMNLAVGSRFEAACNSSSTYSATSAYISIATLDGTTIKVSLLRP